MLYSYIGLPALSQKGQLITALFLCLLLAGCSGPQAFSTGPEVSPPPACIEYRKQGGVCWSQMDVLQGVLSEARAQHRYIADQAQYQQMDLWARSLQGDCEDFALWVRWRLKRVGIASDLVYVKTETGGGHMVISVKAWILDNRRRWVLRRQDLPYDWISLGKPSGIWLQIKG